MSKKKSTNYPWEDLVIKPIVKLIEDEQDYLTYFDPASNTYPNLGQLAKIGYIFNVLFYTSRICYGFDGVIEEGDACESNPKDFIQDDIDYNDDEIADLAYDAWGMHDPSNPSFSNFKKKLAGRELTDFDRKLMKRNKTFDDWVEVLTDKRYRYHSIYPNRRSVANHLLCTIGNGYGYKNGYVIQEASGADQDADLYANWENAKFSPKIASVINKILSYPQVPDAIDAAHMEIEKAKKKNYDDDGLRKAMDDIRKSMGEEAWDKFQNERRKKQEEEDKKYKPYYPICEYSIITKLDQNSDPSYMNAAIEICEDILTHKDIELKQKYGHGEANVKFAEKFLKKFKK